MLPLDLFRRSAFSTGAGVAAVLKVGFLGRWFLSTLRPKTGKLCGSSAC
jgi:hypothetical protein